MRQEILFLTTYPRNDASTRRRVCAVSDVLSSRGHAVRIHSIFSSWLYENKNKGGATVTVRKAAHLLLGLLGRAFVIATLKADVVVIHREAFPFFTPALENTVRRKCRTLIVDVDDGIHLSPPGGRDWRSSLRRSGAFLRVLRIADAVIVASPELQRVYKQENKIVALALTSPDLVQQPPRQRERLIAWIGSYSTLSNLQEILKDLLTFCDAADSYLLVVGGYNVWALPEHPRLSRQVWSLEVQTAALARAAVGIMPLSKSTWDIYKGGYKILLYLAAGVPAVAAPIGINVWIAARCERAVATPRDWPMWEAALQERLDWLQHDRHAAMDKVKGFLAETATPTVAADIIESAFYLGRVVTG